MNGDLSGDDDPAPATAQGSAGEARPKVSVRAAARSEHTGKRSRPTDIPIPLSFKKTDDGKYQEYKLPAGAYFRSSYAWAQICESSRSQLLQTKSCEAPKSQQLVVAKRCEHVNSKLSETKSCVNRLSLLFTQRRPVDVCLRS